MNKFNILLLFNTVKYLRISQIFYRIIKRISRPKIKKILSSTSVTGDGWIIHQLFNQKIFTNNRVNFLNKQGVLNNAQDWNNPNFEKLWLYNAHYFDDLCSVDSDIRRELQFSLIKKWIHDNPPPVGNGWEPYPTSLRIVNWIKAFLSGLEHSQLMLDSLSQQADYLSQDLERHLLGNHLFANGKALIFAGLYLNVSEADDWLTIGLSILDDELNEQVLTDGGNFELSPMYHNIMLTDLLDLINLAQAYSNPDVNTRLEKWRKTASVMLGWMEAMIHPDGEIAFFNDAAIGIAASPEVLRDYARKLDLPISSKFNTIAVSNYTASILDSTGYIRVVGENCVALLDCARVGPDYLPGHAHADTLSFEMSLFGQRLFVNSGTSCYGFSAERLRQRSTSAHNTVVINGENSSEVWGGFRVARRAYPSAPIISTDKELIISSSHDGYRRLNRKLVHHRKWGFNNRSMQITDVIAGDFIEGKVYFYLHPNVSVENSHERDSYQLIFQSGEKVIINFNSPKSSNIYQSTWHPEFGKSIVNCCLVAEFNCNSMVTTINW